MPEPRPVTKSRLESEINGLLAWVEAMPLMDGDDHMLGPAMDLLVLQIPFTKAKRFDPETVILSWRRI